MSEPTQTVAAGAGTAHVATLAGKYMLFQLADEAYALEILTVREIIGLQPINRIPRAPEFIRGIINLRGKVIPVLDLRERFGMASCAATDQSVIIVVQCPGGGRDHTIGLLVDQVLEVQSIEASQIEPPPSLGSAGADSDFIVGVGKAHERVIFLLDLAKVVGDAAAAPLAVA